MKKCAFLSWVCLCVFSGLQACSSPTPDIQASDGPLRVVVSIVPQAYFAERIGGEHVEVDVLATVGHCAETYQVTPRQLDMLGRAAMYFRVGMPFEDALVQRIESAFPELRIVDVREGISLLALPGEKTADHPESGTPCDHGHDHAHDHDHHHAHAPGEADPHIWLDPMLVKVQAHTMTEAMIAAAPAQEAAFRARLAALETDMDELHRRLEGILAPVRGRVMYVYHPGFGYLANAYGFEQRAIEHEGKAPGARRLNELVAEIRVSGTRALFEQSQFASGAVRALSEATGLPVILLDTLVYEYPENMIAIAEAIAGNL